MFGLASEVDQTVRFTSFPYFNALIYSNRFSPSFWKKWHAFFFLSLAVLSEVVLLYILQLTFARPTKSLYASSSLKLEEQLWRSTETLHGRNSYLRRSRWRLRAEFHMIRRHKTPSTISIPFYRIPFAMVPSHLRCNGSAKKLTNTMNTALPQRSPSYNDHRTSRRKTASS